MYEKQDKSPVDPSGALSVSEIGKCSLFRIRTPDKPELALLDYKPLLLHRFGLENKMRLHPQGGLEICEILGWKSHWSDNILTGLPRKLVSEYSISKQEEWQRVMRI